MAMKITALAPWFGSNRTLAENVGKALEGCNGTSDTCDRSRSASELGAISWVIVGGESGHGARSFDLAWGRSLRDQCKAAGVPFFFKQMGDNVTSFNGLSRVRFRAKGGTLEDIPADLRVREFPKAAYDSNRKAQ
jgi:hypothetical protein